MLLEDLARACDLDITTVQAYQRAGLLPAPRTDRHGQPNYPPKTTTARVRLLHDAQTAGLDFDDIAALLAAADRAEPPDPDLRARLDDHLRRLHQRISQLRRVETELRRLAATLTDSAPAGGRG